jgi:hypothetical protein
MRGTISALWVPIIATYLGLAWAAVLHRAWGRRRYHLASIDYVSPCGGFVALALLITLPLPPVMAEVDRFAGLVGLADALAAAAALLAILSWLVYLSRLVPDDRRWIFGEARGWWIPWRVLLVLFVVVALGFAGRFLWAPDLLGFRLGPHPTPGRYYLTASYLLYRAVSCLLLGLVILVLRRLTAVVGAHPALQVRLRVIHGVLWYLLLYIAYEASSAVLWQLPDLSSRVFRLRSLLLLVAVVAPSGWYLVGLALCRRCAAPLRGLSYAWRDWRAYRALYPLWAALYPVCPGLSHLAPPHRWRAWWPDRTVTIALCRVVAEIHDWNIQLWPYQSRHADATVEACADALALADDERQALVEAVLLAAALASWRAARPVDAGAAAARAGHVAGGGATLGEELATLVPIARAFARSPLVAAVLARPAEAADPPGERDVADPPHRSATSHAVSVDVVGGLTRRRG